MRSASPGCRAPASSPRFGCPTSGTRPCAISPAPVRRRRRICRTAPADLLVDAADRALLSGQEDVGACVYEMAQIAEARAWRAAEQAIREAVPEWSLVERREKQAKVAAAPRSVREIAWKAQTRLCRRFRFLERKGKRRTVVATAVARELAAFIWAINREVMQNRQATSYGAVDRSSCALDRPTAPPLQSRSNKHS